MTEINRGRLSSQTTALVQFIHSPNIVYEVLPQHCFIQVHSTRLNKDVSLLLVGRNKRSALSSHFCELNSANFYSPVAEIARNFLFAKERFASHTRAIFILSQHNGSLQSIHCLKLMVSFKLEEILFEGGEHGKDIAIYM